MLQPIFSITVAILVALLVFFISWSLAARSSQDREKSSPFECGFDPKNSARLPFSLRFFLLAVIFLVFDIEIVLLIPLPIAIKNGILLSTIFGARIFLLILIFGLLHEWNEGSLDWSS